MKLTITGRHVESPKSFALYVRKRFKKWSTFLGSDASVHVILNVEGYRHTVEVNAKDGPYSVSAKQTTKDMFRSVDLLVEKVGTQLVRQHEKLTDRSGDARKRGLKNVMESLAEVPAVGKRPRIEIESIVGKPMTHEEAVLQLQTMKAPFLVFLDMDSEQLAVLVRKKDGTYKLIIKE